MAEARVFFGGRIWTGRRFVERLVTEGARVVGAGPGGAGGAEVPTGAERVDLGGRLVVPALVDAHLHVTETALQPAGVDLRGTRSLAEAGERVVAAARAQPSGALWGSGWDQERWEEGRMPDRRDLDRWVPDRPLVLTRICAHVTVTNSAALDAIGVGRATVEPAGGKIDRYADGEPTGLLRERAIALLDRFPYPRLSDRPDLGERFLRRCAGLGIGAVAALRAAPEELEWWRARPPGAGVAPAYQAYGAVSDLASIDAWAERRRRGMREVVGVKLFADGSFGGRGAWLEAPYDDAPGESGLPLWDPAAWDDPVRCADAHGLRVAAHALGDRAIATVLASLERVAPRERARLEHAGLVPAPLRERLRRLPIDLVVQPGFRTSDAPWLVQRLGHRRIADAYPFEALRSSGAVLAGSSDAPTEALDPFEGIRSATRADGLGTAMGAAEALGLYTSAGAAVLGRRDLGHLEPGAEASLVAVAVPTLDALSEVGGAREREVWLRGAPVGPADP